MYMLVIVFSQSVTRNKWPEAFDPDPKLGLLSAISSVSPSLSKR